jgi:hypothetical protein
MQVTLRELRMIIESELSEMCGQGHSEWKNPHSTLDTDGVMYVDDNQAHDDFGDTLAYEEDAYGEIPPGKEVLYSKPEALSAVLDIASSTSCPHTQELLNNFVKDNRTDDYERAYAASEPS